MQIHQNHPPGSGISAPPFMVGLLFCGDIFLAQIAFIKTVVTSILVQFLKS
jgi:hypothetical protein